MFSKYAWLVHLKDERGVTIVNDFQKFFDSSMRKPTKIWVDRCSEFYNSSFKNWLEDNDIEMYSTDNEGKSVVAESLLELWKAKFISIWLQY